MQQPVPTAAPPKQPVIVVGTHDLEAVVLRRQLEDAADILAFVEPTAALNAIRKQRPALALLFMDHDREGVLALAKQLASEGVPSVMVSRDRDPDTILCAMRSGARDFAYLEGDDNDVRRAVTALPVTPVTAAQRRGVVVAVFAVQGRQRCDDHPSRYVPVRSGD